ncbi:MAG: oligosaccharide flippase family protein [Chitinophagales bacterium]
MKSTFEKDTLYTVLVKIPSAISVLIYMVLLTRLLGPEGNGVYTFIITNINIAVMLLGFGSRSSTTFFTVNQQIPIAKILGILFFLIVGAIGIMALFLLLTYFNVGLFQSMFLPSSYTATFFLVFIFFVFSFQYLTKIYQSIFAGYINFKYLNIYELISSAVKIIFITIPYFYCHQFDYHCSITTIFSWVVLIEFVNVAIFSLLLLQKIPIEINFSISIREELIPFFRYGTKQYVYSLAEYTNKRLDVWLIEFYQGTTSLGLYALATQSTNFMLDFTISIRSVLFPYLTKMNRENGGLLFCTIFRGFVMFYTLFVIGVWFSADVIVPFVFGKAFVASVFPMKLLSIGILFGSLRNILHIYNNAYNRQRHSIVGTYIGLTATVFLGFWFIPIYGIVGAAYVSITAYGLTALYMLLSVLPHLKRPLYLLFVPQKTDWLWIKEQYVKFKSR